MGGIRKTTIALYLLQRLKEVGIDTIFGVPGDYNLSFLDILENDKELTWGNNANELNAAYAADGYARVKGAGAVLTTFGVGELSATNGIAGSYAEMVPVIHLVGTPSTSSQATGALLHHSLGNGDFSVFINMYTNITAASAHLTTGSAARQIDEVLSTCLRRRRPGYIGIPADIVNHEIMVEDIPLDYSIPKNPPETQEAALKAIIQAIEVARHPIIIADACVVRNHMHKDVAELVKVSGFPVYSAPMSIDVVDHNLPNYRGCYSGASSLDKVKEEVLHSDLILELGSEQTDVNTGGFTYGLVPSKVIEFHTFSTKVFYSTYEKVAMQELVPLLIKYFPKQASRDIQKVIKDLGPRAQRSITPPGETMLQDYFWNKIVDYLPERSVVIAETGTPALGAFNLTIPKDCIFICQVLWGSIGYTVPSTLGAALADRSRRVFLMVGDGSFQLTAQEVSVMLHHGVCPIILLFNNDGYLIEKLLHAYGRKYNDFQMWEYANTFNYMGANLAINQKRATRPFRIGVQNKITTRKEFESAMHQAIAQPDHIHFLEIIFPSNDAPEEVIKHSGSYGGT
ncbi:thiamine diphosphate-binding protein [Halteromyces radiatus]|uniref:thiamine diphosphate-binding protein n=1 Tax=Halteromyces radiatus TaxID=101107 RepID=UPI00221F74D8|nr:thiamine diphosphate-binding protein [Halteromyces radiatus]KAI8078709.1 thiamine diphosphate-binding protein [Halteromyces radiatus]